MTNKLFLLGSALCLLLFSCTKDKPDNPYDDVDYSAKTNPTESVDATSIAGLHKNIFFPKCARSGCHDGTFEPDFRTVQSSYATLVYHPAVKTTVDNVNMFTYRVIPGDTVKSFLHERLVTPTTEYMPSNGVRLSRTEIEQVNSWIMKGAKDQYGNIPSAPDAQPFFYLYLMYDGLTTRIDSSNRENGTFSPIVITPSMNANLFLSVADDFTPISQMINVHVKFSKSADDFSNAISVNGTFVPAPYNVWQFSFSGSAFTLNTQYFFRFYFNDGKHTDNAEFPRTDHLYIYKEYSSLKVK